MQILNDKNTKLHAVLIVSILLIFLFANQLTVRQMADEYKKSMIAHDDAIAGCLSGNGIEDHQIILAFTAQKSDKDVKTGSGLLTAAGYKESINRNLIPEIDRFYQKYAMIVLVISLTFSLAVISVFLQFVRKRDKQLIKAGEKIRAFMGGDTTIRLDDSNESSLSRLFSVINSLATSLNTHIEKEKHSQQFLRDTISDISHQLKTPLASLQIYNEIIANEKIDNEVVENFTLKSQSELARMENLILNLLKLARLDSGTIELEKRAQRLKGFLEKCRCEFITRAEIEGKVISLQCDSFATLYFDEIWLGEALGNIIKNALDHTDTNAQIEISCTETVVATEITVKDNGKGIHQEDIHYIFRRFYRSRYSKDRQGIGIGLALAKAIVEQHGGIITVQSELGHGTTFHMIFAKLSNL